MACCEGIADIPVQSFCSTITLPLTAPVDGLYTIIKQSREMKIINKIFDTGEEIEFENVLNENETIIFQVKLPDGTIMTDVDGNDCFRIKIIPYQDVELT